MASPGTVVFVHAHPDDEAIFTGGTMALLAQAGHRVVLVVATSGELGILEREDEPLGSQRRAETIACCDELGPIDVRFMGFADSGLQAENPQGFAHLDPLGAASELVAIVGDLGPVDALVSYDDHGIYGHPDHVQVHRMVAAAAPAIGVETIYESTVDREYLHFVETHVVVEAGLGGRPIGRGLAASDLGLPSLLVDTTVDVGSTLERKRRAMAAHASQLPADAPAFALGQANFGAVYGYEWYRRVGPASMIEELPLA